MAVTAIGLVIVVVLVLVLVKVTTRSTATSGPGPVDTPAPAGLVAQVTGLPASVFDAVGVSSSVLAPSVITGESPLAQGAKPAALYIGAEYCPFCAGDRWATIVAFSRFGSFSGLQETTSSPWDAYPSTATFSFHGAQYRSDQIVFTTVEHEGNDTTRAGTRKPLEPLTRSQESLWSTYSARFGVPMGYPFLDIGNKVFVIGPAYDMTVLSGLDQATIAAKLTNPKDPVTRAVVGAANYLTAGICSVTGGRPESVCSSPGTTAAAKALKLS